MESSVTTQSVYFLNSPAHNPKRFKRLLLLQIIGRFANEASEVSALFVDYVMLSALSLFARDKISIRVNITDAVQVGSTH